MLESNVTVPGSGGTAESYLTKREVAERLHKKVRTIDNYMKQGILPYFKLGRSVLFRWSDVQKHLERHYRVDRGS
jgi:excisionase family DNA binding protein